MFAIRHIHSAKIKHGDFLASFIYRLTLWQNTDWRNWKTCLNQNQQN